MAREPGPEIFVPGVGSVKLPTDDGLPSTDAQIITNAIAQLINEVRVLQQITDLQLRVNIGVIKREELKARIIAGDRQMQKAAKEAQKAAAGDEDEAETAAIEPVFPDPGKNETRGRQH